MGERIYTIPLNEAMEAEGECPLCILEKKLEETAVEFVLGPSMMEPDARMESNEKGFCRHHYKMMYDANKRLPMAFILKTHLDTLKQDFAKVTGQKFSPAGLFRKSGSKEGAERVLSYLEGVTNSCVVCEKLDRQMAQCYDNFLFLWETEEAFAAKIRASKGFCLAHLRGLLQYAVKHLSGKQLEALCGDIYPLMQHALERLSGEVDHFTKKFDYRFADEPWNGCEDAVLRSAQKLNKYF